MTWWRVLRRWLRHPADSYWWHWKASHAPRSGDRVTDCRGLTLTVTAVDGDNLTLEDGTRTSWMHCCGWPSEGG
jgi:hypothetical protein